MSTASRVHIVKATEKIQARPQISTTRERFHQTLTPFALPVHIRTKDSEQQYTVANRFTPSLPNADPIYVYSWLDDPLSQVISTVLETNSSQIPKEWTTLTISSIYISNGEECKLEVYLIVPVGDHNKPQPALLDYRFEIGDHFDFHFQ